MKALYAIPLLLWLWMASLAAAGELPSMTGVATAKVGETCWINVAGEPEFDAKKTIAENAETLRAWLGAMRVACSSPDGAHPVIEPDVQVRFNFAVANLQWDMRIKFIPDRPGVYVVAAALATDVALHRVEVGDPNPTPVDPDPIVVPQPVDRVTLVYEKDQTSVPRPVSLALQKLNKQGILATEFEQNTVSGDGTTPSQYRIALQAAREAGLPCLIAQAGDKVVRVVKSPMTEQAVLEAVK